MVDGTDDRPQKTTQAELDTASTSGDPAGSGHHSPGATGRRLAFVRRRPDRVNGACYEQQV